ncbi:formate dehydrogenase accessory sulfurtransferase FdhD [Candidatus Bathyarchaeota archaeon]|nr:formate dehydrogenase accessory sulfurtransferase FdhD [Candidatus Bathyarchaeota archaeon]MCK4481760.1 formate dehydrogenase accessory sulfurtransferase FdhD [Candidatus Bathyarchaeota archaeon]
MTYSASQAAAIKSRIEVASHCKITLIGFARGKRMNIYTYPQRVDY